MYDAHWYRNENIRFFLFFLSLYNMKKDNGYTNIQLFFDIRSLDNEKNHLYDAHWKMNEQMRFFLFLLSLCNMKKRQCIHEHSTLFWYTFTWQWNAHQYLCTLIIIRYLNKQVLKDHNNSKKKAKEQKKWKRRCNHTITENNRLKLIIELSCDN